MKSIARYKSSLGAVLIFVLALFVYNMFFNSSETVLPEGVSAETVGDDLIKTYEELQTINLQNEIFSSPAYLGLVDFSVAVPEQPTGRPNPFSIIGRE